MTERKENGKTCLKQQLEITPLVYTNHLQEGKGPILFQMSSSKLLLKLTTINYIRKIDIDIVVAYFNQGFIY